MTYDMLTGYIVWYWGESSNWSKLSVGSEITSLNLSNLGEYEKNGISSLCMDSSLNLRRTKIVIMIRTG